jgi:hypothetical protein
MDSTGTFLIVLVFLYILSNFFLITLRLLYSAVKATYSFDKVKCKRKTLKGNENIISAP